MIRYAAAVLLCGCTSMLPMTETISQMPEDDVQRVAMATGLTEAQVRDPTIHEVHEVRLSFTQMLDECYPNIPWYMKALGSVPLACTKIIQQPWNEKVAIIYYGWYTDPWTMAHEREHAQGKTHAWW
jgi:hypothetical protein